MVFLPYLVLPEGCLPHKGDTCPSFPSIWSVLVKIETSVI